jgi:hypothetical protein
MAGGYSGVIHIFTLGLMEAVMAPLHVILDRFVRQLPFLIATWSIPHSPRLFLLDYPEVWSTAEPDHVYGQKPGSDPGSTQAQGAGGRDRARRPLAQQIRSYLSWSELYYDPTRRHGPFC